MLLPSPRRSAAAATSVSVAARRGAATATATTAPSTPSTSTWAWLLRLALGYVASAWIAFQLGVVSTALGRLDEGGGGGGLGRPPHPAGAWLDPPDCSSSSSYAAAGLGLDHHPSTRRREAGAQNPSGGWWWWWGGGGGGGGALVGGLRRGDGSLMFWTVPTLDFVAAFAPGFPLRMFEDRPHPHKGSSSSRVLLLVLGRRRSPGGPSATASSLPRSSPVGMADSRSNATMRDTLSACREVRQVVTRSAPSNAREAKSTGSCLAVVIPTGGRRGADSYLMQKWILGGDNPKVAASASAASAASSAGGWQMSGRYQFARHGTNTLEDLPLSKKRDLPTISREELASYQAAVHRPETLHRLQVVADRVASAGPPHLHGTVVVLTVNSGHADLFVNYVCAARAAGINLSKLLLIATDEPAYQVAVGLGVAAFYDRDVFAVVPAAAAKAYGDSVYAKVMMSKAYAAHLLSVTGHDFLFQDVDIIPYNKDYLEWWIDVAKGGGYDLAFQSDFSNRVDYAPWSANSGCYFAVNNARTRYFFADMVWRGDSILKTRSHQAPMHAALSDHASLFGLRVRTLANESSMLPMGYHFHRRPEMFRDPLFKNKTMSLHMNWNREKTSKRLFLEQMGDWRVRDECLRPPEADSNGSAPSLDSCCVDRPLAICHYRDVPSLQNCDSSPALKSRPGAENGNPFTE